jgi:DNA-directed RNA polymerase specialized sigma24 family protein
VLRRRRRWPEVPDEALLETVSPKSAAAADARVALQRALRALPADQREVVHLHVFEGMTFLEVAAVTVDSINTVASRYRYALAHMRRVLAP